MSYNIVSVVQCNVNSSICKNNSSYSANCEQKNESNCEISWCCVFDDSISHCCKPAEDFYSSRNGNYHCSCSEIDT
jgi:hypothetical protein